MVSRRLPILTHLMREQIGAKRVLGEIIIMKNLEHENVLGLLDVVYNPSNSYVCHLPCCLLFN